MIDFERRYEILALTLGLKPNTKLTSKKEEGYETYTCLFSIYQKMIEQDNEEFFINKDNKKKIIDSLKNTIDFYKANKIEDITQIIETLEPNDPTSFLIVPLGYPTDRRPHVSGMILYKQKEGYLLAMVDKTCIYNKTPVASVDISNKELAHLSHYIFYSNKTDLQQQLEFEDIKKFILLSEEKKATLRKVKMAPQYVGNCVVSEIETTVKVALFNCKESLFKARSPKKEPLHPKWSHLPNSTLEMRKRFLEALKTENVEFNKKLDDIFNEYYLQRKKHPQNLKLQKKYRRIEKLRYKKNIISKLQYFIAKKRYRNLHFPKWLHYKMENRKKFQADPTVSIEELTALWKNQSFLHSQYKKNKER